VGHVVRRIGIILRLAPAPELDRNDPPFTGEAVGHGLKIASVASQSGEAQDRRTLMRARIVAIVEFQPVVACPVTIDPLRHAIPPTAILG